MKSLQQQLKFLFPFYKRASLLLFLLFLIPTIEAQVLYIKDTKVTINGETTVYIASSGEIHEEDLKNFEGKTSEKKRILKSGKQKKTSFNCHKTIAKHPAEKTKSYPKVKSVELAVPHPDDFFSLYSKGEAVSAFLIAHDYTNYFIENKRLRITHEYSSNTNNNIISNRFIFLKDYYWFQCKNRPPPSSLVKKIYNNV
ncbi:hypothetical protein [Chryseobacterium aureum]|uniref:hypothetical protein n=1 Tax=Chryseobacterium aureum TaxID=2497456 RepID=UPI000F869C52|nr:hypothetical protein [Chryseobacterium aureum]